MSTSVPRIPLLLTAALAMNRSFVRPNPAVPTAERRSPNMIERTFVRFVSSMTTIVGSVSFIPALADTCIILHHARDLAPSNWVDKIDSLPFGSYRSPVGTPLVIVVGATMAVAGVGLRRWAMATLGRHFTLELTLQPTHKLMTSAPYNIVRHPSYTGGMMALGGALLAFCAPADGWFRAVWLAKLTNGDFNLIQGALGWGATTLLGCIFTLGVVNGVSRTRIEDSMLRERFGKDWDVWAKRVPYKLVPFVY